MTRRLFQLLAVVVAVSSGVAACSSTVIVEEGCVEGEARCGEECVDLESDPSHCGDCGVACPSGECFGGECFAEPGCQPPASSCGGACVDLSRDPLHCGGCFTACEPSAECVDSQCVGVDVCEPPLEECFGGCVDTQFDPLNCGGCGLSCGPQQSCQFAECVGGPECPDPLDSCFGNCVDLESDPLHCGFCGNACPEGSGCVGGVCELVCSGPCGTCAELVFLPSSVPQSLAGTTQGADWLGSSCGAATGPEVVHSFVAPSAGSYVFSTAGSSFDTVLSLRDEASCGELACNDDFGGQASSRLSTFLEAGQAVYVVVDGKLGASGSYALSINGSVASSCPTLALPSSVPQIVTGNTSGGPNSFTPSCTGFGAAPEHTFTFTAPATASYTFDTVGSPYDTVLYILGASCTGLQLACNDDTFGLQSQIVLALSEGQTVTIVVDGFGDQAGSYTLHIQ